jgi:hypothetical protein
MAWRASAMKFLAWHAVDWACPVRRLSGDGRAEMSDRPLARRGGLLERKDSTGFVPTERECADASQRVPHAPPPSDSMWKTSPIESARILPVKSRRPFGSSAPEPESSSFQSYASSSASGLASRTSFIQRLQETVEHEHGVAGSRIAQSGSEGSVRQSLLQQHE